MWRCSIHLALLALAFLFAGCKQYPSGGNLRLHMDMVDQPSYRPQRDPLPLPEGSVPRAQPATPAANGKTLYGIYCLPCHGASGRGDGPVAAKIARPANLLDPKYRAQDDASFYEIIRAGNGGLMPPQAESLYPAERRRIVEYLRELQK